MIYRANQWTGFYTIETSIIKELSLMKKLLQDHRTFLTYFVPKFPQYQPQQCYFFIPVRQSNWFNKF